MYKILLNNLDDFHKVMKEQCDEMYSPEPMDESQPTNYPCIMIYKDVYNANSVMCGDFYYTFVYLTDFI